MNIKRQNNCFVQIYQSVFMKCIDSRRTDRPNNLITRELIEKRFEVTLGQ